MTDTEKKLLQAQHRLEEAQARDRVKERKARTRRLIQEGAILEKVLSGIVMLVKPLQVWKAEEPMLVTPLPIVTLVSPVQL